MTLRWMRHAREWWHGPGEVDVQGAFLCTPMTGGYWACVGRVESMWPAMKLYNAVADAMLWILEKSDGVDGG